MPPNPWTKFAVRPPSTANNWTIDCQPLVTVSHVAHVPIAVRIVEDARLRADLVFDDSKLNTKRIRVVWMSPNDWDRPNGFRYGNVRFSYDWATLLGSKKAFWVESIAYGVEACRILITETDYSSVLDPYDPTIGDGPWWVDSKGQHYWNGKFCLEVMVEHDVLLTGATKVDFVKHHGNQCNVDYKTCTYCGWTSDKAGAEFLGLLASAKSSLALPGLVEQHQKGARPSMAVHGAIGTLSERLSEVACSRHGTVAAADVEAPALARALLRTLADGALANERAALAAQFKDIAEADAAVMTFVATALGLPNAKAFGCR